MKYSLMTFLLALVLLSSCRQQKELVYFDGLDTAKIVNETLREQREYKIRINDILYVKIMTADPTVNQLFMAATQGASMVSNAYFTEDVMYYSGLTVRLDGTVDVPAVGPVFVIGKTIEEARQEILKSANNQLKLKAEAQLTVLTKLANFKVTLLGELLRPGTYNYYNNQTTVLEAIGKAGDLTDYGNRQQVLIIRPTVDGSVSYRINLQDPALLTSAQYFIQPNDVIYVPPLKAKGTRLFAQDYGVMISAITSTLTTASLILTIILNLKK